MAAWGHILSFGTPEQCQNERKSEFLTSSLAGCIKGCHWGTFAIQTPGQHIVRRQNRAAMPLSLLAFCTPLSRLCSRRRLQYHSYLSY